MDIPFLQKLKDDRRYTSIERVSDPILLFPPFRLKIESILAEAKGLGQEFVLFETYRSTQRQAQLFAEGRTKLARVGVHHYGLAADLVRRIEGRLVWEADYALLGKLAKRRGLTWGGDWRFRDEVHVQGIPVSDQSRLFSGVWFPTTV